MMRTPSLSTLRTLTPTSDANRALIWALACAAVCLAGCGAGASYRTASEVPAAHAFEVHDGGRADQPNPEVAALAERFYALPAAEWSALDGELAALLAKHPRNALLHEIAAYGAVIRENTRARWHHFLEAASDLSSPHTELYLSEAFAIDLTVGEIKASIALLKQLLRRHPRSSVRADAARRLVDLHTRLGEVAAASAAGKQAGYLTEFQILGPFDNDQGKGFLSEYDVEKKLDLAAPVRGLRTMVSWRHALVERDGMVSLGAQLWPSSWTLGYLVTHVFVPADTDAELRITTSTSVRAWVNDAQVASDELISNEATDNVIAKVRLVKGWNRLLLKSADRNHDWVIGARVTAPGGAALAGLRVSSQPQEYTASASAAGTSASATARMPAPSAPSARGLLLEMRAWALSGFSERALAPAQTYLAGAPENPLAIYFGALVHSANGEGGKAIDLYNHGVDALGESGTAFLRQRARYLAGKERWDRALDDYRLATTANPGSRLTAADHASLLGRRGWHVERCEMLEAALKKWPDNAPAVRELAQCLGDRGYYPEAEAMVERALALEPGSQWSLGRAAYYAAERYDFARALELQRRALELDPINASSYANVGDYERRAGNRAAAKDAYRAAARINPTWSRSYGRLGLMAQEDGNLDEAIKLWRETLVLEPDDTSLAEHVEYLRAEDFDDFRPYAPSDDAFEKAVAAAPGIKAEPGGHSVLVLDDEVTLVASDGSARSLATSVWHAVTTEGRDALLQTRVPRTARVLTAFAQTKDGKRLEASSIRDGVIRFRGVEVGTTVAVQYINHRRASGWLPNHYVGDWYFQGLNQQYERSRWVVVMPEDRELAVATRGNIKHTSEKAGSGVAHTFLAEHVPPLNREPYMGAPADLLWRVDIGTLPTWNEYVLWERALLSDVFETSDKIKDLAERLTKDSKTPHDKLDALFAYAAQEIRYQQDYENTIAGVKPHSAAAVIERGYGDCKDKAVLLIMLARTLGIEVRFALVRTRDDGTIIESVPNQQFNHAIAYVPKQKGIDEGYFIDATTDGLDVGNLRSDDQGTRSLVLDPVSGAFEFVSIPYSEADKESFDATIDIDIASKTQVTAKLDFTTRGSSASGIRRVIRNAADAERLYQGLANSYFPGAAVKSSVTENGDDIWKRLHTKLELDISSSLQAQGPSYRIGVPSPFKLGEVSALTSRKTPVRLGPPESWSVGLKYKLPAGAKVKNRPGTVLVEIPCFSAKRTTKASGRTVQVDYSYRRTCTDIPVADYGAFREAAQKAANQLQGDLVLDM
jgi:tetratricopeptide (TPR) repeat protein